MHLPKQSIEEFKAIYLKEFGRKIDDAEAEVLASQLLEFVSAICKPIEVDRTGKRTFAASPKNVYLSRTQPNDHKKASK